MLTVETIGRIRREHFLKGKAIREIARDLKVSRNTVRKVLRSGETSFEYERSVQPRPKRSARYRPARKMQGLSPTVSAITAPSANSRSRRPCGSTPEGPREAFRPAALRKHAVAGRRLLAAASKPALANSIAGLLAFAEKLHIGHDRLVRMDGLPMLDVCFIIGNADHQPRRSRRPIDGCARSARGSIEQVLQVRHCDLLRLRRQARFPRRSPAGCRELSRY